MQQVKEHLTNLCGDTTSWLSLREDTALFETHGRLVYPCTCIIHTKQYPTLIRRATLRA